MKIGELARRSGLAPSRIRFYEARGLIAAVPRAANGYRDYPEHTELLLALIDHAQRAGFSLAEIRGILPQDLVSWHMPQLQAALQRKLDEIVQRQELLRLQQDMLQALLLQLARHEPGESLCVGATREVLAQLCDSDSE